MIERALANVNQERSAFGSGAYINPITGEILDSAVMENLLVAIDPKTGRPMMSGRMTDLEELERSLGSQTFSNLVRKGLFKHSGGDPILADLPFIATIEKGPHFYGLSTEYSSPAMLFNTGKGDNPTLRPKSRGSVFAVGDEVGEVQLQGRPHPVYEKLMVAPVGSDVQGKLLKKAAGGSIKRAAKAAKKAQKPQVNLEEEFDKFQREANLAKFLEQSKVPQRLYHGTTATEGGKGQEAIRRFKPSKEGSLGSGVYLTPKTEFANEYAHPYVPGSSSLDSGNVLPVYAQLKNPLVIEGTGDPMIEALVKLGMDEDKAVRMVERAYENKGYIGKEVETRARAQGYDGLMQYGRDGNLSEVVSYNPNAVKSAIGNRGTYDVTDPDITKAAGGAIKKAAKAAKAASKASDVKEQPIYWGMYRGYVGDDVSSTEPQFAAMDRNVAEYYAKKRAAQTGLPPHLEMIYKQLDAGRKYGHTVPIDQHNRELLITQAYELQPEDIKGRYQLKKHGGRVKGNI